MQFVHKRNKAGVIDVDPRVELKYSTAKHMAEAVTNEYPPEAVAMAGATVTGSTSFSNEVEISSDSVIVENDRAIEERGS